MKKSHTLSPLLNLRNTAATLALLHCAMAGAQLHEQINVEGKYVPEIIKADRINAFPKAMTFPLTSSPLQYEGEGVAAGFAPMLMPLPATGWRADRSVDNKRGYIEAGTGSWLNSTLSAGYRFIDTSKTVAGIRLQHNSTSLWKPEMSVETSDARQWRYDESVGLYASHVFGRKGRLDAAADYHLGVFNYYGWSNPTAVPMASYALPTQTLNDVAAKVDWRSALSPEPSFSYSLTGGVRYFAYRANYLRETHSLIPLTRAFLTQRGLRETNVNLGGKLLMPWDNGSSIGLDINMNYVLYSGGKYFSGLSMVENPLPDSSVIPTSVIFDIRRPDNYFLATLTPFYRFSRGLLDVKLGADIDIAYHAGEAGNRYPFFHVAPEVRFGLQTGQVGMYLNVLGGSTLNTLANGHQMDYYAQPFLSSSKPTYTPLDATFGLNFGPFAGFSAGIYAAYKVQRDIPLGGWYTAALSYGTDMMPGLPHHSASSYIALYSYPKGINIHGCSVGANMEYSPSGIVSVRLSGTYQPQNGEKGYFNGYDRARLTARAEATVSPIAPLRLSLAYDYRGVRNIYLRYLNLNDDIKINGEYPATLASMRLPDLCMLNFAASWDFSKDFSVWMQADNLLGRHDAVLPLQPMQGLVLTAGVKYLF